MSNISFIECEGIKNCPCCNSKSEMVAYQHPEGYSHKGTWFKISCSKCGMRTCKLSSKAQAKKTWNRRKVEEEREKREQEWLAARGKDMY